MSRPSQRATKKANTFSITTRARQSLHVTQGMRAATCAISRSSYGMLPVESGWFIPPQPSERAGPLPRDLVTQTEDVLVDTRGYIYVTDKQWGLWILRYTGSDQPAPTDK
jgi:hypothetical protein